MQQNVRTAAVFANRSMVMRELHLPALKDLVHWQPVVFGGVQDAQRAVHHGGRWGAGRGGSLNFMPGGGGNRPLTSTRAVILGRRRRRRRHRRRYWFGHFEAH